MQIRFPAIALAAGSLAALPLMAHHSFAAEYDGSKTVTIKGKVAKVDWVNPHSWIFVEVTDANNGKTATWECETAPPNSLYRQGWRKDSLKPGDEVTVDGFLAKDGTNTMNARTITLSTGRRMFAGSATDGAPADSKK
jgi:hypothetical protein